MTDEQLAELERRSRNMAIGWSILAGVVLFGALLVWTIVARADTVEDWETQARSSCLRHACDPELLIAIGTHEPDARKNQSLGDGGLSFGRWQMKATTAARYVLGTTDTRRMTAEQYLLVAKMLTDDRMASELAGRELSRCSARNRMLEYKIRCWNNESAYVAKVMAIYRARKRGKP